MRENMSASASSLSPPRSQGNAAARPTLTDILRGDTIGAFSSDPGLNSLRAAVDTNYAEISRLLQMESKQFWESVARASSLHQFLDNYIRFENRFWRNLYFGEVFGVIPGASIRVFDLDRELLRFLHRLFSNKDTENDVSSRLDPEQHIAVLQETKWLDLPKLMDISALFFDDELMRNLIANVIRLQPSVMDDIGIGLSYFLNTADFFCHRCMEALEVLASSPSSEAVIRDQVQSELLSVRDVILGAVITMDRFIDAYKPAAIFLSCPSELSGQKELLNLLGRMYDTLMPLLSLQKTLFPLSGVDIQNYPWLWKYLPDEIPSLGRNLLVTCYFDDYSAYESFENRPIKKLFPATVDDPTTRGDIIFQTLKTINENIPSCVHHVKGHITFIKSIEDESGLLSRIRNLREKGWVVLDEEKFSYISKMMMPPSME